MCQICFMKSLNSIFETWAYQEDSLACLVVIYLSIRKNLHTTRPHGAVLIIRI